MASAAAAAAAAGKVEKGHEVYREGKYREALLYYTEALTAAKTKPQKIALHSNRAACYLKLHSFHKAAEECTCVLQLDQRHSGALMLRAQTLVTLKEYHSALFDVTRLLDLNPFSEVYLNLEARLRTQLVSLAPIPESETEFEEDDDDEEYEDSAVEAQGTKEEDEDEKSSRQDVRFESIVSIRKDVETKREEKSKEEALSNGWKAIPKPKGHSTLDYGRWDTVEDDSSEDDDSDEDSDESQPQYRFRVRVK